MSSIGRPRLHAVTPGAALLSARPADPVVALARGDAWRGISQIQALAARGAYVVEWREGGVGRPKLYVGGSAKVSERLRARRCPEPFRVLAVAPPAAIGTGRHGFAVERFAWTDLMRSGGADVLNLDPPTGCPLPCGELRKALSAWQTAVVWLSPFLEYLSPAPFRPWCVRELEDVPPGRLARLRRGELDATAVVSQEGWTILAGSLIRSGVSQSVGPGQAVLRLELGLADMLSETRLPGVRRLDAPVWRASRTAATVFVTGARGSATAAWEFLDPAPRPGLDFRPGANVIPFPNVRPGRR